MVRWPEKIRGGKIIEGISGAIDLLPTIADLATIEYVSDNQLDGISFKNNLIADIEEIDDRLIYNYWRGKLSVRNQRFRLDRDNELFDISVDRGQANAIGSQYPKIKEALVLAKKDYVNTVVRELPEVDLRTFPLGHPDEKITQIPARDGTGHGNIIRSNRFPNCSFYTNWIDVNDSITWDVEVLESGDFEVMLYYTCPDGDEGSTIELSMGKEAIQTKIIASFDSPLSGMEHDRIVRMESYVKEFRPLSMGIIHLEKGPSQLKLKALSKPGKTVIDVRLLLFKRI